MASKKKSAVENPCACAEKIDKLLAPRNAQLVSALRLKNTPRRVYLAVEKLDTANRQKPPMLAATYCPFCGKKAP